MRELQLFQSRTSVGLCWWYTYVLRKYIPDTVHPEGCPVLYNYVDDGTNMM